MRALAREISRETVGSRVARVDQPGRHDILLSVRRPGGGCRVLLSADTQFSRIYITSASFELPRQAPAFCMLLRKRLEGGKIEYVEPAGLDRICMVRILSRDELGNPARWTLVLEATGRSANILLLDPESRVVATARRAARSVSGGEVSPGAIYSPPAPSTKTHPCDVMPETLSDASGLPCEEAVLSVVAGFGRTLAREACTRATAGETLAAAVHGIWDESECATSGLVFLDAGGNPVDTHVVRLSALAAAVFESPSAALDHFYRRATREAAFRTARQSLGQKIKVVAARTGRRLASRLEDLDEAGTGERYRKAGDLILTYLAQVTKSLSVHEGSVKLPDPETGEDVALELDLSLDAPANAQVQYRKYAKLKARFRLLSPFVEKDRDDLAYLDSVADALDRAQDLEDLLEIEKELRDQGFLTREKSRAGAPAATPNALYARFVTSAGEEMLAGKNNRQNEQVTFRAASRQDLWFHTKSAPGAHVVLRLQGSARPSDQSLIEAATVAATLSKARSATKVEVDFTAAQNVRKRPGSRPGMVLYDKYQTIVVRPDKDLLVKLSRD